MCEHLYAHDVFYFYLFFYRLNWSMCDIFYMLSMYFLISHLMFIGRGEGQFNDQIFSNKKFKRGVFF